LAERRTRRQIRIPKRYLDTTPQPPAALPPLGVSSELTEVSSSAQTGVFLSNRNDAASSRSSDDILQVLLSPCNAFGLFRQYYATCFPLHDPEELNTLNALSDIPDRNSSESMSFSVDTLNVSPYPNHSSFALGEWYWSDGVQKSKKSFKNLINILTDPNFRPHDLVDTKWDLIDHQLGSDNDAMWVNEEQDAAWERIPVTFLVPFHRFTTHPGAQEYTVPGFFHRSVVSILKEKLVNDDDFRHFHLEPYELRWQRNDGNSVRVHGELYNSPAFIEAHNKLQNSPKEPDCDLPRIVVGLMFASDSTHLTSFGNAKIWPLYLFFGNESKYRRGKPTLHLCNHVAYFLKVSNYTIQTHQSGRNLRFCSFPIISRTSLLLIREVKIWARHSKHTVDENFSMHSGKSFWMTNFSKPTLMVLL
jgi:Plavaka transposase